MTGDAEARAAAFVRAQGDALARVRLDHCLDPGDPQRADLLAALPAGRGLSEGQTSLCVLDLHGCLGAPVSAARVAELAALQDADGAWPCGGPEPARVARCAMLAGHLTKSAYAPPAALLRASAFLSAAWSPERVRSGDWDAIAGFAHFFSNSEQEGADEALQWCGREFERVYRSRRVGPVEAGWLLLLCDAGALPGARLDAVELGIALRSAQWPDGSFARVGMEAAPERVEATLDALLALGRFGG